MTLDSGSLYYAGVLPDRGFSVLALFFGGSDRSPTFIITSDIRTGYLINLSRQSGDLTTLLRLITISLIASLFRMAASCRSPNTSMSTQLEISKLLHSFPS